MSDKTFQVRVYSLVELPKELRVDFKLEQYPFLNGPAGPLPPLVDQFFKKYQIVHYRDELRPHAICCQPDDGDPTPIQERSGFTAYNSQVVLNYSGMTVSRWSNRADPRKYRLIVAKHGDDLGIGKMCSKPGTGQPVRAETVAKLQPIPVLFF